MRDVYLDKLAMAGGEGSELLRRINTRRFANIEPRMVGMIGAPNYFVEFYWLSKKIISSQYKAV